MPDFRQFRPWLIAALGWSVPALASTTRAYFGSRDEFNVPTLGQVAALEVPAWVLWVLVTPVVFQLARRLPLEGGRWPRALAAHGCTALAILALSSALVIVTIRSFMEPLDAAEVDLLGGFALVASQQAVPVLAIYAALAATAYAVLLNNRLHTRRLQHAQLQSDLSRAELSALKMQLRPHFLFNALQSVSTLVDADPEAAKQTLARIGDVLRTTLRNGGREMVCIDEEVGFLEHYLSIERTRFGDRLAVDMRVEANTRAHLIPGFLLQPLVENALHHGVAKRIEPGRIEIDVSMSASDLQVRIRDTGPGFPDKIREGFGLAMTRKRLANIYDGSARMVLDNAADGGAVATLFLPPITREAEP